MPEELTQTPDVETEAEETEVEETEEEEESEEAEEAESSTESEAGNAKPVTIPKPRFDEVNEKRIRAEAEAQYLREQLRQRDEPKAAPVTPKERTVDDLLAEEGIDPDYATPTEIALARRQLSHEKDIAELKADRQERQAREQQDSINKAVQAEFMSAVSAVQDLTDIKLTAQQMNDVIAQGVKIATANPNLRAFEIAMQSVKAVIKGRKSDALKPVRQAKAALAAAPGGSAPPGGSKAAVKSSFQDALARSLKKHGVN